MVKIKSRLKLIKIDKTARVVRGGCICKGCDFVKIIIVCNFSKKRRAPRGWHHCAETCSSVPYNIGTL